MRGKGGEGRRCERWQERGGDEREGRKGEEMGGKGGEVRRWEGKRREEKRAQMGVSYNRAQ